VAYLKLEAGADGDVDWIAGRCVSCITRTLQLTRPSVAALPQDLAAERQSLGRPGQD
jgi:hypothetical protein